MTETIFKGYIIGVRYISFHDSIAGVAGKWSFQQGRSSSSQPMIYSSPKKGLKGKKEGLFELRNSVNILVQRKVFEVSVETNQSLDFPIDYSTVEKD